ncbi:MAG: PAS domain-containing protein [Clostridia bacterium]|nr:PAS domain-containing protein [Clostridia bacterium]
MSALGIAVAAAGALAVAALAYACGVRAERGRWWPIHSVASFAVERGRAFLDAEGEEKPGAGRLARELSAVVRGLLLYWDETREDLESMRRTLDGLDDGVILLDPLGRVIYANHSVREAWSPLAPVVTGKYAIEVFRRADVDRALGDARRDGKPRVVEYVRDDGSRTYEVRIRPLGTPKGDDRPFLLVVLRDVTELRAVERMRREFVANASHELRTPLTAIQGYADTLAEEWPEDDPRQRYLANIVRNVQLMVRLLDDMMTLARLESFETPFHQVPLDLAAEVQEAHERMQPLFRERNLAVDLRLERAPTLGDPDQIQQVIGNLLSNAARYTPPGGRVSLRTDVVELDGRPWARLVVEDTGIGVPPADRTRIFERFYRVDKGRSRETGGTGLGLAIVKHVVLRHDGRVWVEGREGGPGSRFVCVFPAAAEDAVLQSV